MTDGDGVHVIRMPDHAGLLSPILHTIPLQLLAYHAALARGNDVDKPRNLAKSVTVEYANYAFVGALQWRTGTQPLPSCQPLPPCHPLGAALSSFPRPYPVLNP